MLEPDEKRSVDEVYTCAMSTSNMRVEADVHGDADLVIAGGMSKNLLGGALMRLHTEFDRSARPRKPTRAQIDAIAVANPKQVPTDGKDEKGDPIMKSVPDFRSAERAAWSWFESEARTLAGNLKSLTEACARTTKMAEEEGIESAARIAPQVVHWWLMQQCHVCHGVQEEVVYGTGRLSGRVCGHCKGTGKSPAPGGNTGKRLANLMDQSVQATRDSIRKRLRQFPHHE